MILQRHESIIRFFYNRTVFTCKNWNWSIKPDLSVALVKTLKHAPQTETNTFGKILSFSYHKLSPHNIGAILIYLLTDNFEGHAISENREFLDFTNPHHHDMILSYLRQIDGATFISSEGTMICSQIHLGYSDRSASFISQKKGTRHTSAQRYSYDKPDCIAITVSEEGPKTIYSDGIDNATISEIDAYSMFENYKNESVETGNVYSEYQSDITCPTCGKTSIIYSNTVSDDR
ncbi:MAG TPA: diadenylate cyclase, partial [Spirochaetota bacterium]|nr:diadenylate cyclase [Spirochaetota bacterium]